MSKEFAELVSSRDHVALVMVAYWAGCLSAMEDRWWASVWPEAILEEVCSILPEKQWDEALRWPAAMIRGRHSAF